MIIFFSFWRSIFLTPNFYLNYVECIFLTRYFLTFNLSIFTLNLLESCFLRSKLCNHNKFEHLYFLSVFKNFGTWSLYAL